MATKGREPVTGLLGAVQQLSPTIPTSYGTTPVQVQESISWQETGIGKLSQALGLTVQGLSVAKDIGEIREQEAIEDLNKLNFEDFQKKVKENKEKYGTEVRKNNLPFLGNPWNQEAVREAAGARYHDEYQSRLNVELQKSNSLETTQSVIDRVYKGMVEDFEITDPTVKQGFDVSIRGTNQRASLQYDTIKNKQANQNVLLHGESALYNASSSPDTYGEIDEWWEKNQATFRPAELIKLIEDVAVRHASGGDEEAADDWLEYAANYLPVGQRTLEDGEAVTDLFGAYTSEIAEIRERVKSLADKAESKAKIDAAEFLIDIAAEAGQVEYALSQGNTYTLEDGTEITSQEQYTAVANERAAATRNPYAQAQIFDTLNKAYTGAQLVTPEENGMALFSAERQIDGGLPSILRTEADSLLISPDYALATESVETEGFIYKQRPEYKTIAESLIRKYTNKSLKKSEELSSGNYIDADGNEVKNAKRSRQLKDFRRFNEVISNQYTRELQDILNVRKSKDEARTQIKAIPKSTSYIDPSVALADAPSDYYNRTTYFDLETAIKEGNRKEAEKIAKDLGEAKNRFLPAGRRTTAIQESLSKVRNTALSDAEKNKARREVFLYAIASKGADFYSVNNIRKGSVNIEGTEVGIADKEALQELSKIYPMLSKDRIRRLGSGEDQDASDVYDLFNALYGTSIEYDNNADPDPLIKDFITQQKALYEKR